MTVQVLAVVEAPRPCLYLATVPSCTHSLSGAHISTCTLCHILRRPSRNLTLLPHSRSPTPPSWLQTPECSPADARKLRLGAGFCSTLVRSSNPAFLPCRDLGIVSPGIYTLILSHGDKSPLTGPYACHVCAWGRRIHFASLMPRVQIDCLPELSLRPAEVLSLVGRWPAGS